MEIIIFVVITFVLLFGAFMFKIPDLGFLLMFDMTLILLGISLVFGFTAFDYSINDSYSYTIDQFNVSVVSSVQTVYEPISSLFSHGVGVVLTFLGIYLLMLIYEKYSDRSGL